MRDTGVRFPAGPQFEIFMQKRIFIIHGWGGYPEEGWFPWLKQELERRVYSIAVPAMPESGEPKIESWVSHLSDVVGIADENTFFVGHSIGCQAILRYLESLPANIKVGGAVFVAGFFTLTNIDNPEEKEIAKPWLETPIDFEKIKQHTEKFIAIFSDNDPYVPLDNKDIFADNLGAKIIEEHDKKHFSGSTGTIELPVVLASILEITREKQ